MSDIANLIYELVEKYCVLSALSLSNVRSMIRNFENGKKQSKQYHRLLVGIYKQFAAKLPKDLLVLFLATIDLPSDQMPKSLYHIKRLKNGFFSDNKQLKIILEYHESNLKQKQVECEKKSKRGRKPKRQLEKKKFDNGNEVSPLKAICLKYVRDNNDMLYNKFNNLRKAARKSLREKGQSEKIGSDLGNGLKMIEKCIKWLSLAKSGRITAKVIRDEFKYEAIVIKKIKNNAS